MTDKNINKNGQPICSETQKTEYTNGKLKKIISSSVLKIAEYIEIAIMISKSIQKIHSSDIIYKNLNPDSIFINTLKKSAKIIDSQKSVQQDQEFPIADNYYALTDQIAYLSPEQTGYMNRMIDYRSDYYSLGVILYELFTSKCPFHSENNYEMIISHLSKKPDPLYLLNPDIPQIVSEIVLKLLSKNAEDRYQSMKGLITDLNECQRQLDQYKTIEPFPIARKDFPERLNISQKLYGRETEMQRMETTFERVKRGAKEMLLITGSPCTGKTYLVKNFQLSVVIHKGFFISGKYDEFQQNIPYSAIIAALRDLIRQASRNLMDTHWKIALKKTITANVSLLLQQIPELEAIFDRQHNNSKIDKPHDFHKALLSVIQFFGDMKFPMTIFLDDLQWIDPASLSLIEELMTDKSINNLLIIGVYRQIDVNNLHPLMLTINKLINDSALINTLVLENLHFKHLHDLLSDTLMTYANNESITELANKIYQKTKGNPFQVKEFLQFAKKKNFFVNDEGRWKWNMKQVDALLDFKDEVDLMVKRINFLSMDEQIVLQKAAFLGGSFEFVLLKIVCNDLPETVLKNIFRKLLSEQIFISVTDEREVRTFDINGNQRHISQEFKFSHDCIQKAAYERLSEQEKYKIHLDVGSLLKNNIKNYEMHSILFCIVNNLDQSIHLITSKEEKKNLSLMYYLAGTRARYFSAYETALKYLLKSIELMNKNCWENDYKQALNLYNITAETAFYCGEYDLVNKISKEVLYHAKRLSDKMDITEIQIQAYMSQSIVSDAISTALDILNQVGIKIPEKPTYAQIFSALLKTIHAMAGKKSKDLKTLPHITNPIQQKAMRILFRLYAPAYQSNTNLLYFIVLTHMLISLRHGNTKESAFAYAAYGSLLIRLLKQISKGEKLGSIALNVHAQFENDDDPKSNRPVLLLFINLFLSHWEKDLQRILPEFLENYNQNLKAGEIEYAANALALHSAYSFFIGKKLSLLNHEMSIHSQIIKKHKQVSVFKYHMALKRIIENLLQITDINEPPELYNERISSESISYILFIENYSRHFLSLVYNHYSDSYKYMKQAGKYLDSVFGTMTYVLFHCSASLTMIGVYPEVDVNQQTYILAKVSLYKKKLKKWAFMAEKNYLEKYYFVEAEYSRILGNNRKAMKYYDLAIEAANKNKFIHFQAFINEYAARFYLSIKKKKEACFYLNEAIKKYLEWEAFAKVNQLNDNKDYVDLMLKYEPTDDCQDILNVSSTMFNDYSDKKQLLSKLMKTYMDIVSAQNVILFVINKNNCILCQKSKDHLNISEGERNKLFHQCDSLQKECINFTFEKHIKIIANSALEISSLASVFKQTMNAPLSIFCLPLIVEKNYIGVVYLENKKVKGLFTPGIIQKIEKFTSLAAVSINNAIQFKKIDCQNSKTKDSINKRSHVLYRSGQANKIGELASGVAHELNQPLSIINIHAGIIKGYFQKNDPVSTEIDKVSKIVNQIARTSEIVDNMLIFSRLKADGMEFTKTDEQLKNLLRFFYEEFRIQEIKYDVFINENLPLARINGQKFDQMIVHLILNAQYAVDEKAKVMGRSYEKYLSISLCFDDINKTIVFQISDNGIGMSHDILVNCVKPFYSTKAPGDGMGLGLFYVNMIVEKYKLILEKISSKDNGSTFKVVFPLTEELH